jgi:hypothetical protein
MHHILISTAVIGVTLGTAIGVGMHLADSDSAAQAKASINVTAPAQERLVLPTLTPTQTAATPQTLDELRRAFGQASTLADLDPIAQQLAELGTPESVQALLDGIEKVKEWPVRAALAKNLRAISNPECLQSLLPALLNNYGRGNTILNEISDTIARLAQPETVEDLAALHWQASVQAGQGHKVLRTVAAIRNPAALRGLMKVASRDDSPALVAAANEAIQALRQSLVQR